MKNTQTCAATARSDNDRPNVRLALFFCFAVLAVGVVFMMPSGIAGG
ncbi:hypothetical protein [Hyphomicrobium sp. ghe19]|nr:hypothetical protein HYPP_01489 [Hyphomicrobium sp. ghe19]